VNRLALHYRLFVTFVVLVAMFLPGVAFAQDSIPGIPILRVEMPASRS
jgi:hypothetical protein